MARRSGWFGPFSVYERSPLSLSEGLKPVFPRQVAAWPVGGSPRPLALPGPPPPSPGAELARWVGLWEREQEGVPQRRTPSSLLWSFTSLRQSKSEPPDLQDEGLSGRPRTRGALASQGFVLACPSARPPPSGSSLFPPTFSVPSSSKTALLSRGPWGSLPPGPGPTEHHRPAVTAPGSALLISPSSPPPSTKLVASLPEAPGFSLPHWDQGQPGAGHRAPVRREQKERQAGRRGLPGRVTSGGGDFMA